MVMMLSQYPVWQCAMSQQFYGAVEVAFQPFFGDARIGVVVQCFIDAGDRFHLLQHCAYVVTHEYDGAILVDFCQQLIQAGFETLVNVGAGFVEDNYLGIGDDGAAQ